MGYQESPNAVGLIRGDSVSSQSRYSIPTVRGFTFTSGSDNGIGLRQLFVNEPSSPRGGVSVDDVVLQEFPLAVLANEKK